MTNVTAQRKTIACFLSLAKAQEETPVVARLLERLPQGLATQVGEGARRLSGGQRQIVATLRALSQEADVIVFDEATAGPPR